MVKTLRFSIDDGTVCDYDVAKLLEKYGFTGIFYIAPYFQKYPMLSVGQIKEISERHEIGGHTLSHCVLSKVSETDGIMEILEGKHELEEIIGKPITKFAYCRGHFNNEIKKWVKLCGFKEGRTMKLGITDITNYDDYEIPCTAHMYPRPEYKGDIRKSVIELYKEAKAKNGYFNLLMHSAELNRYKLWDTLESILNYIKNDNN